VPLAARCLPSSVRRRALACARGVNRAGASELGARARGEQGGRDLQLGRGEQGMHDVHKQGVGVQAESMRGEQCR
jgi:hypothetical protein